MMTLQKLNMLRLPNKELVKDQVKDPEANPEDRLLDASNLNKQERARDKSKH